MYRRLNIWPSTDGATNYKLVAEIFRELSDLKSWEGYRCDAVCFPAKIREIIDFSGYVIYGSVPKQVLKPLIEEYNSSLQADPVLSEILAERKLQKATFQLEETTSTESIQRRASLLSNLIAGSYRSVAEGRIIEICAEKSNSRLELIDFCKRYVSSVLGDGFEREYFSGEVSKYFYRNSVSRCDKHFLSRFFKKFHHKTKEFDVYLSVNEKLASYLDQQGVFQVINSWDKIPTHVRRARGIESALGKYVKFGGVPSKDPYGAANVASHHIRLIKSFQHFDDRRQNFYSSPVMVVAESKSKSAYKVSDRQRELSKFPVLGRIPRRDPSSSPVNLLTNVNLIRSGGFARVFYSLNSMALSLAADSVESKLVNCWAAFEALLPEPSKDDRKTIRVTHFVDVLTPCVVFDYPKLSFQALYRDARREFGEEFRDFVAEFGVGAARGEQLSSLIIGKNSHQADLCSIVAESPLLLQRLKLLQDIYSDPGSAISKIERHEQRVRWQLHRIYRQRNEIVHSGRVSSMNSGIIDNAHSYYYSTIRLLEKILRERKVSDAEVAIELVGLLYRNRMSQICELRDGKQMEKETKQGILRGLLFSGVV